MEDKEYLKIKISINESLEEFYSGDLEIKESENQKELNQIEKWDKIEIKNNNNNKTENELQNQNIILKNKIIRLKENKLNLTFILLYISFRIVK